MSQLIRPGDTLTGFFIQEGRCFRIIASSQIQATHCADPAPWRGRFTDTTGKMHRVWSCERHVGELGEVRRVERVSTALLQQPPSDG
jgi:hypothetical protein